MMKEPIAVVINNNQDGWKNIIETKPNVTLMIGEKLYSESQIRSHISLLIEKQVEMLEKAKVSLDDKDREDWIEKYASDVRHNNTLSAAQKILSDVAGIEGKEK